MQKEGVIVVDQLACNNNSLLSPWSLTKMWLNTSVKFVCLLFNCIESFAMDLHWIDHNFVMVLRLWILFAFFFGSPHCSSQFWMTSTCSSQLCLMAPLDSEAFNIHDKNNNTFLCLCCVKLSVIIIYGLTSTMHVHHFVIAPSNYFSTRKSSTGTRAQSFLVFRQHLLKQVHGNS